MLCSSIFKYCSKLVILFCLMGFCTVAFAQQKNISGLVVDNNGRVSSATVHDLQTGDKTFSNIMGQFTIKASIGDTLITTLFNHKPDTLIIDARDNVMIKLKILSRQLREVEIKDSSSDPAKTYADNKVAYKDIYWKGDKSHIVS